MDKQFKGMAEANAMTQHDGVRRRLVGAAALVGSGVLPGFEAAALAQQAWPTKPVRCIVPFPPGGGTDAFARPLSRVISAQMGQQLVIDNRGGAGGTLGADLAAKAPGDGYTWLIGAVHHAIAPSMYKTLGYDIERDLAAIAPVSFVPNVLVVNPNRIQAKTYAEFLKLIQSSPGKFNYASAGNGTSHHLTVELWKTMTRSFATHIPYRGAGPALADLLAGQVDFMFDGLGSAIQHIKAGKLRPLAVTTKKRSPVLPDVPTLEEVGVKGYEASTWYGLFVPASTPKDVQQRIGTELNKALNSQELRDAWAGMGADAGAMNQEQFQAFVKAEVAKWAAAVKASGAKLD